MWSYRNLRDQKKKKEHPTTNYVSFNLELNRAHKNYAESDVWRQIRR